MMKKTSLAIVVVLGITFLGGCGTVAKKSKKVKNW